MRIELIPSVEYIKEEVLCGKVVILIDVLRATSVITTALSNGAREIVAKLEVEEALAIKRAGDLLGGERKAMKIQGFDLSNSPLDYKRELIEGKRIIMSTTNGTKAILLSRCADKILIGSMLNGRAAAARAVFENKDIVIVCAGTYGRFSLDDFICGGKIIYDIRQETEAELDDFAASAFMAYSDNIGNTLSYISMASHYKYLKSIGLEDDIKYCFTEDIINVVPEVVKSDSEVIIAWNFIIGSGIIIY